ncbi:hypothetical protein C0992_000264, partial [Termitomyces sp. T32_za158]
APPPRPVLPGPLPAPAASTGRPPLPPEPRAAPDVRLARVVTGHEQAPPRPAHASPGPTLPLVLESTRDLGPAPAAAPPPPSRGPPPPPVTPPDDSAGLRPTTGDAQTGAKRRVTPRNPPWQQTARGMPGGEPA